MFLLKAVRTTDALVFVGASKVVQLLQHLVTRVTEDSLVLQHTHDVVIPEQRALTASRR